MYKDMKRTNLTDKITKSRKLQQIGHRTMSETVDKSVDMWIKDCP